MAKYLIEYKVGEIRQKTLALILPFLIIPRKGVLPCFLVSQLR